MIPGERPMTGPLGPLGRPDVIVDTRLRKKSPETSVASGENGLAALVSHWTVLAGRLDTRELLTTIAADLRAPTVNLDGPFDHLRRLTDAARQVLACRSVDTATHLKLSLDQNRHRGLRVWLHVYKPWNPVQDRYAASVHDHRYPFASKILRGGYREDRWAVSGTLRIIGSRCFSTGEVNVVGAEEVHSLGDVVEGTITLVVQLPTARQYSTVYRSTDGTPTGQRVFDVESQLDRLLSDHTGG